MKKLKETKHLEKLIQEDMLGEIPVFFNKCIIRNSEEVDGPKSQAIEIAAFQTDKYRVNPYHKVVSKII